MIDFGELDKGTQQISTAEFRSQQSSVRGQSPNHRVINPNHQKNIMNSVKPDKIRTVKRNHKDYLTKLPSTRNQKNLDPSNSSKNYQNEKIPKMLNIEPEATSQPPYIRKSGKKNLCDEVSAEPFEIIESQYFKKLLKNPHNKEIMSVTPKNLNFDVEKTEKKVQTSIVQEHNSISPNVPKQSHTVKHSVGSSYQTLEERRTFNSLVSLKNLADKPM